MMKKLIIASLSILMSSPVFAEAKAPKNNCQKVIAKITGSYSAECKYRRTSFDKNSDSQTTSPLFSSSAKTDFIQKSSAFFSFEDSEKGLPVLNLTLAPSFDGEEMITDFRITCTKDMIETTFRSTIYSDQKTYQRIRILRDGKLSGLNAVSTTSVIDDLTCIFTPSASK